ncbi:hypothetical protein Tco_1183743 [Tanacetum coccineum]
MSNHEQPTPSHPKSDVRNTTGKNKQILQDSVRTTSAVDLEEFCEKHYEKLLQIMADKYEYEKRKKEKPEEVKARLDFGDARKKSTRAQESAYSESRTISPRRQRRSRSPRRNPSVFTRLRRERSRSPRHEYKNKERRESTVFKRLGSMRREVPPRILIAVRKAQGIQKITLKVKIVKAGIGSLNYEGKNPVSKMMISPNLGKDPEDHLKIFQAAAKMERWTMPTWCHMFNSTLTGNARCSTTSNKETESPQKTSYKGISRKSGNVKGAPECMRISGFVHGITNPELIKRFHEKIPKTVDEMMQVATSFLQGQEAASNQERKKSSGLETPGRGS